MPKGKKHGEEQIIGILKQGDAGVPAADLCRQYGISEFTLRRWRSKFGGMEISDAKRLKGLESENTKLKHIVADLTLDNKVLKELLSKKF